MVLLNKQEIFPIKTYKAIFKQFNSIYKNNILDSYLNGIFISIGFLSKFPKSPFNFILPILITAAYSIKAIKDKTMEILYNYEKLSKIIRIDNSRFTFIIKKYDIELVETKEDDEINLKYFLELDFL